MPNTLAHIGAQGLLSRAFFKDIDIKWIYAGSIVPDAPWILQRVVRILSPGIDIYTLRAYSIAQASFFMSLILCLALALLAGSQHKRLFLLLGSNVIFHLVLDAIQIKWANGVHWVAPFSWDLTNWGLFWPEHPVNLALTGFGLLYIAWHWRSSWKNGLSLAGLSLKRAFMALFLAVLYLAVPLAFVNGPIKADNHFIRTLQTEQNREGQLLECDRAGYRPGSEQATLQCWDGEPLIIANQNTPASATLSVRARFVGDREIEIIESHTHFSWFRDNASYLGLGLVFIIWVGSGIKKSANQCQLPCCCNHEQRVGNA